MPSLKRSFEFRILDGLVVEYYEAGVKIAEAHIDRESYWQDWTLEDEFSTKLLENDPGFEEEVNAENLRRMHIADAWRFIYRIQLLNK